MAKAVDEQTVTLAETVLFATATSNMRLVACSVVRFGQIIARVPHLTIVLRRHVVSVREPNTVGCARAYPARHGVIEFSLVINKARAVASNAMSVDTVHSLARLLGFLTRARSVTPGPVGQAGAQPMVWRPDTDNVSVHNIRQVEDSCWSELDLQTMERVIDRMI